MPGPSVGHFLHGAHQAEGGPCSGCPGLCLTHTRPLPGVSLPSVPPGRSPASPCDPVYRLPAYLWDPGPLAHSLLLLLMQTQYQHRSCHNGCPWSPIPTPCARAAELRPDRREERSGRLSSPEKSLIYSLDKPSMNTQGLPGSTGEMAVTGQACTGGA